MRPDWSLSSLHASSRSRATFSFLKHLEKRETLQALVDFKIGISALKAGFRSEEHCTSLQI
jgi:hypothetical protein